jgi:F-type H+-transporting ATPase subunit alpha
MPVEEQVVSIFAGTRGFIDDIPTGDVRRFEEELLEYFRSEQRDLLGDIKETRSLPEEEKLTEAINSFKQRFSPSEQTEQEREQEDLEERTEAGAEAEAAKSEESQ